MLQNFNSVFIHFGIKKVKNHVKIVNNFESLKPLGCRSIDVPLQIQFQ